MDLLIGVYVFGIFCCGWHLGMQWERGKHVDEYEDDETFDLVD